jgi:IS5 family transposase
VPPAAKGRVCRAKRRLEAISTKGDPLETIRKMVPLEDFRADIETVTETKPEERKSNAGRKPYDAILKFKVVVVQSLHNLSDEQTEYMRFLDLELEDPVPDTPRSGCFASRWHRPG